MYRRTRLMLVLKATYHAHAVQRHLPNIFLVDEPSQWWPCQGSVNFKSQTGCCGASASPWGKDASRIIVVRQCDTPAQYLLAVVDSWICPFVALVTGAPGPPVPAAWRPAPVS